MKQPLVIFVVDDEEPVRRALMRVLRRDFVVHTFARAEEALAQLTDLMPALVISDNTMPGLTGVELLRELRAQRPGIRTIMVTGGPITGEIRAAVSSGEIDRLLEKPWEDAKLRGTVRELLNL